MKKLLIISVLLAGCCGNTPNNTPKPPDRFETISLQHMPNPNHSNFSIMVIKDRKTEKEFRVVFNSHWGLIQDE